MKNFWLVLQREYITRVRKKSFLIITILAPILMIAFYTFPAYLAIKTEKEKTFRIGYITQTADLKIISTKKLQFINLNGTIGRRVSTNQLKKIIANKDSSLAGIDGILFITSPDSTFRLYILSDKAVGMQEAIKNYLQQLLQNYRLKKLNVSAQELAKIFAPVSLKSYKITEQGTQKANTGLKLALAAVGAFLAYIFVFIYGGMAMRSVMEEKVNRVVELIVSSVKPVELMFGKIIGIMLVALTQFIIWLVLGLILFKATTLIISSQNMAAFNEISSILESLKNLNLGLWFFIFLFYFLTGYIFYGAMFAAIGSAVDVETDAQQFVWPLTIPMLVALMTIQVLAVNPGGAYAVWMSIIPFTSPIVMILRVSFGVPEVVPYWQLILSMVVMLVSVWIAVWMSAKIFRMGILFYGKRPTYRDLIKWIKS